jgi:hypothetical protein
MPADDGGTLDPPLVAKVLVLVVLPPAVGVVAAVAANGVVPMSACQTL